MANRFSNIVTSGFKGLSLDEIMAIPLAKQAQQDASLASTDELQALQAKRLEGDAGVVDTELDRIRKESESISSQLMERGVDRDLSAKLRKLRNSQKQSFGASGVVGQAQANYEAAQKYINDMATKKEMQAGWSPAQAKAWATKQVREFGSSFDNLGNFTSFTGSGLATKVDTSKFIRDAIDDVAEKVEQSALNAIKVGGLPAFQKAFQSKTVSSKDYNTIMRSIMTQANADFDLINSLKQEAEFTGEANPLDHGNFEFVKDDKGNVIGEKWVPGKSSFGRKAAGIGDAADYKNIKLDTKIMEDKVAFLMYTKNLERKEALDLVVFNKGEMNQITVDTVETTEKLIEAYGSEVQSMLAATKAYEKKLKDRGFSEEDILADKELNRLKGQYEESNVNYKNSKARLKTIYKKVEDQLTPSEKLTRGVKDSIDEYGSAATALEKIHGLKVKQKEIDDWAAKWNVSKGSDQYNAYVEEQSANILYTKEGGKQSWWKPKGFRQANADFINSRKDKMEKYLEANPQAEYFTRLNGEGTSKYAIKLGRYNKLRSGENFDPSSSQLAYKGGLFNDSPEIAALGESKKGFDYKVEATDGWDDTGNHFDNVIVTNKDTGVSTSVQVINNMNNDAYTQIAYELLDGSPSQQKMGTQLLANMQFMKSVKESGLTWQNEGEILLPRTENDSKQHLNATYKKEDGEDFYTVKVGNYVLNNGQPLYGEKDIAMALWEFNNRLEAQE